MLSSKPAVAVTALLCLAMSSALHAAPVAAQTAPPAAATSATQSFNALLDAQTLAAINADPELRTVLGISGDGADDSSDRLTDVSLAQREVNRRLLADNLAAIKAWNGAPLDAQQQLSDGLARWFYQAQIDLMAVPWSAAWLPVGGSTYAVDQLFSLPVNLPQFFDNQHQVTDAKSARHYIARLNAMGTKLDQVRANLDMQAAQGVVPPEVALDGAATQFRTLLKPAPKDSLWVTSLQRRLDKVTALSAAERTALIEQATLAVRDSVNPGYQRLLDRVQALQAAHPGNKGMWALPHGDAYYDAALRWYTSTDLGADAIHQIGLDEVARLEKSMDARLRELGLREGTVAARIQTLREDPRYRYADSDAGRQQLIGDIEQRLRDLDPLLPTYFGHLPPQKLVVQPVPTHMQATSPGGYYYPPAMDGSRPGTFYINLGDIDSNTRWSIPTLTYHEGSPGHHFQISIGQTLTDLPLLRRSLNPSAFSEGWALYAEQLMAEAGVYKDDPAGDIGRLQAEMFRSVRLVLDTGLHRKRWTPEQAIAYMREKTGMKESDVRIEVNRYLVQPGQASSYKMGQLRLLALREKARTALGPRFDIRAFHDLILGNGAMPMTVVEQAVDGWIASGGGDPRRAP
ncbi:MULTISPECIES: DUF885 domain-containing protein [Stenotrophomonas]|uniref:DUF885 domain-containing protein n=1 Tax=Stenotrophomonas TaxID=40323 RepID=UPI000893C3D3|nr:DUF885 domain-containing protein [Stenotrophomonas sp. BIIR7]OEZ02204.1 hypothetical protein BIY45_02420 [Stenotrophomonas sp. BIIR7]